MVPQEPVELPRLPRLPSGKIDRKALERLNQPAATVKYSPPRDQREAVLVSIWCDVLGLARMGMDDNFFESGGHSLLAIRVISKIQQIFHVDLSISDLFDAPILSDFAGIVKSRLGAGGAAFSIIEKITDKDAGALSFGQKRLWFMDKYDACTSVYNMPVALRIAGDLNPRVVQAVFNEIARRHETLRTLYKSENGSPVQVVLSDRKPDFRSIESADFDDAVCLLSMEAEKPFDLENDPLLRVVVVRIGKAGSNDHILFFNIHHIASDGWSINILLKEFSILYEAFSKNSPSPMPELSIQYPDYGAWQKRYLETFVYDIQLDYWKKKLEGLSPVLELPTDLPRPKFQTHNGGIQYFSLDKHLSRRVKAYSNKRNATLFMTLNTVFSILLSRYTGRDDIATGFPIAGRHHDRTEALIGFFVNTLALRINVSDNDTIDTLLDRVKMDLLGAFDHQDIPFEKLIDELGVERNIAYPPLLQVVFSLVDLRIEKLYAIFDAVKVVEIETQSAKIDLTFSMYEKDTTLHGVVEYNSDLFFPETIRKKIDDFKNLLSEAMGSPDRKISRLLDACRIYGSPAVDANREKAYEILRKSNLTKNQLLTFLGQKMKPESSHYNNPHLYEIRGEIHPEHFMAAFDQVVSLSDSLSSTMRETDDIPQMSTLQHKKPCKYMDLSQMTDAEFHLWVRNRSDRVFDLEHPFMTLFS